MLFVPLLTPPGYITPLRIVYASRVGLTLDAAADGSGTTGTDNSVAIQAVLDQAHTDGVRLNLIIDGPCLVDTLYLWSYQSIRGAAKDAAHGLFKKGTPNSGRAVICNKNFVTGPTLPTDRQIAVQNLYVDGNRRGYGSGSSADGAHRTLPGNSPAVDDPGNAAYYRAIANDNGYIVPAILMAGANGLVVDNVEVRDSPSYGLMLANCRNWRTTDYAKYSADGDTVPGNDILHLNGHTYDGTDTNLRGTTHDDALAFNANDGNDLVSPVITFEPGTVAAGPIRRITSTGMVVQCQTGVRFLTADLDNDITGITIDDFDITINHAGYVPFLFDTFNVVGDSSQGYCDDITIRNGTVGTEDGFTAGEYACFQFDRCNFGTVTIENVETDNDYGSVRLTSAAKGTALNITNLTTTDRCTVPPFQLASSEVDTVTITGCDWDAPGTAGNPSYPRNCFVDANGSIPNLTVTDCTVTGAAQYGVLVSETSPDVLTVTNFSFTTTLTGAAVKSLVTLTSFVHSGNTAVIETDIAGYTIIAHTVAGGTADTVTTGAIDTTGASRIVLAVSHDVGSTVTVSDSKGNTFSPRTEIAGTSARTRFYDCLNPVVGTGHTFTVAGTQAYPSVAVIADNTGGPFGNQAGAAGSDAGGQPGSLTPTGNHQVVFTAFGMDEAFTAVVNSGFTISDQVAADPGNHYGVALAYKVQTAAAAVNPTWSGGIHGHVVPLVIAAYRQG